MCLNADMVATVERFVQFFTGNGKQWLEQKQTSILSAAAILTASVVLSSLTGLISYRLLASRFYDPSTKTQMALDAYWVAFQPSEVVFQLLVIGALSASFIPVFTRLKKQDEQEAFRVASSAMNAVLILFALVAMVVLIFADRIIDMMTGPNFSPAQIQMAATMTRLLIFAQFFFAISNFLSGMLQSYQRFIVPAFSPVAYNVGIIFGILVLSPFFGIYGAVYGALIGAFLHMSLQIPLVKRLGFVYSPIIDWKNPGFRDILQMSIPRTIAVGIDLIQPYFLTFFVTSMAGTSLTIMRFAQKLMAIPIRMFGVPIGQAALPFLSEESDAVGLARFNQLLIQSIRQVAFFAMPASALLLILRIPVVRFAFGARNFPWPDTILTGKIVAILAISVTAQAITHILVRAFYALHDTRRPFIVSVCCMILGVAGGAYVTYGTDSRLLGLAVVTTTIGFLETIVLWMMLYVRVRFSLRQVLVPMGKMFGATFLMGASLYSSLKTLDITVIDTTKTLGLLVLTGVVGIVGMTVYIVFAWLLRVEELSMVRRMFHKTGIWKQSLAKSNEAVETASMGVNPASEG